METLTRITLDPDIMGGKACIRGLRVTVGTVVGLLAAGRSPDEILEAYPYLEGEDIAEALAYSSRLCHRPHPPNSTRRCTVAGLMTLRNDVLHKTLTTRRTIRGPYPR